MAKKPSAYTVKLIRGASFVVPGYHFLPGKSVPVSDPKIVEACRRSQQFKIVEGEDVDDEVEDTDTGEDTPAPAPKKKKKRR